MKEFEDEVGRSINVSLGSPPKRNLLPFSFAFIMKGNGHEFPQGSTFVAGQIQSQVLLEILY